MTNQEKRKQTRVPVVLRIKLRYQDVGTFIDKFAVNLSRGGMFIASRSPKQPGTIIKFELKLADQSTVISGAGVVKWKRDFSPDAPRGGHGMGIEFSELTDKSSSVIDEVVRHRHTLGLTDDAAIPRSTKTRAAPKRPKAIDPTPAAEEAAPTKVPPPAGEAAPPAEDIDSRLATFLDVDVEDTLTRARTMAENALAAQDDGDDDLRELLKVAPAPVAVSVEAASAEISRLLAKRPSSAIPKPVRDNKTRPVRSPPNRQRARTSRPVDSGAGNQASGAIGKSSDDDDPEGAAFAPDDEVSAALDALESDESLVSESPVIATAPTEDQLEQALSEIDDSDLGPLGRSGPTIERPSLPGLGQVASAAHTASPTRRRRPSVAQEQLDVSDVADESADIAPGDGSAPDPVKDFTYSAPLGTGALDADALLFHVDDLGEAQAASVGADIDATLAALEDDEPPDSDSQAEAPAEVPAEAEGPKKGGLISRLFRGNKA